MLEGLDLLEHFGAVEHPDVLRLRGREAPHGPRQVNEVRLHRRVQQLHAAFSPGMGRLLSVSGPGWRSEVRPRVEAAARERHHVVASEGLARTKLYRRTPAALAGVTVAREEEGVRDLAAEPARHGNELREADTDGPRIRE